jgi:hypothetical protein
MFWLVVMASGLGIVLGVWLRVHAVTIASSAIVLGNVVLMPIQPRPVLQAVTSTIALLCALQCGYLVGLMVSYIWARAGASHTPGDRAHRSGAPCASERLVRGL